MVCRVGLKYAVLDDGDVAVGALSDDIAAVEDTFASSEGLRFLCSHDVDKKVQSLDIAVQETRILHISEL